MHYLKTIGYSFKREKPPLKCALPEDVGHSFKQVKPLLKCPLPEDVIKHHLSFCNQLESVTQGGCQGEELQAANDAVLHSEQKRSPCMRSVEAIQPVRPRSTPDATQYWSTVPLLPPTGLKSSPLVPPTGLESSPLVPLTGLNMSHCYLQLNWIYPLLPQTGLQCIPLAIPNWTAVYCPCYPKLDCSVLPLLSQTGLQCIALAIPNWTAVHSPCYPKLDCSAFPLLSQSGLQRIPLATPSWLDSGFEKLGPREKMVHVLLGRIKMASWATRCDSMTLIQWPVREAVCRWTETDQEITQNSPVLFLTGGWAHLYCVTDCRDVIRQATLGPCLGQLIESVQAGMLCSA